MVVNQVKDGRIWFTADSDAIITKGIISLLISVYSGRTPEEIASDDFSFIDQIGLKENLSPTRANGLVSMIATIRGVAAENLKKK
jgi:cysteine desulfuration protein SufE